MTKEEPKQDDKPKKGRSEKPLVIEGDSEENLKKLFQKTPEQIDAEIQAIAERGYEVAMRKLRERAAEAREAKDFARAKRLDRQIRRLEH